MAAWTYVIYAKTDFATLDFAGSPPGDNGEVQTNASLTPIYITVKDDDSWFSQDGGDTGQPQIITASSDPSLVGERIWSEVYGNADTLYVDDGTDVLTINEISIGETPDPGSPLRFQSDYVLANLNGANTALDPSTTYTGTGIRSDTVWAHSGTALPCFTAGTRIGTPNGPVPIETLRTGDLVRTADHGAQPIRWIGRRTVSSAAQHADPTLRPIRIAKGAMGGGLPARDMRVSRQHRMLVRSRIVQRMLGAQEALVPAIKLVGLPGIAIDNSCAPVTYLHILCRRHEILYAEHCPAESLFLGDRMLDAAAGEAFHLFADLPQDAFTALPARAFVEGKRARHLMHRHLTNRRPPLAPAGAPVAAAAHLVQ